MSSRHRNLQFWFESKTEPQDAYMKRIYGEPFSTFWKDDEKTKFVTEREYWDDKEKAYSNPGFENSMDSSIQCDLAVGEFDPRLLPYNQYMKWHLQNFCRRTSAHGIPQIGQASNKYVSLGGQQNRGEGDLRILLERVCGIFEFRGIWTVLFVGCMIMLYINAQTVVEKYNKNEKIVDIELKFDTAPFPSITVCNLNPYKASVTKNVDLIKRTLSAFDGAMNKAGLVDVERTSRIKRLVDDESSNHSSVFEPGYSKCKCKDIEDDEETGVVDEKKGECEGERFKWDVSVGTADRCICAFDRSTHDAWPCYLANHWIQETCFSCDSRNKWI